VVKAENAKPLRRASGHAMTAKPLRGTGQNQ